MTTTNTQSAPALDWDSLFRNGIVIDLDISIWPARVGLKAADLGFESTPEVHSALALGCHRLIPAKAFEPIKAIAGEAKRTVEYFSLTFPFVKGARYVPATRWEELRGRLLAYRARFDAEVGTFIENLEATKAEMLPIIRKAMLDASRTPESAESAYERICAIYPSPDVVRKKFGIKWSVYSIRGARTAEGAEVAAAEAENVKSVIRTMVEQLRGEFTERVSAVMGAVARGGKIIPQTVKAVDEVLNRIDSMNVFGDRVLSAQVNALRTVINTAAAAEDTRDPSLGIGADLETIRAAIDASAEQAVRDAEESLTGVGRRRFATLEEGEVA